MSTQASRPGKAARPLRALTATGLFTLAAGAATYGAHALAGLPFGKAQLAVIAFLGVLTAVLIHWQERSMAADPKGFMSRFMLALALKLVVSLVAVAAILLLKPRSEAVPLALTFTALYLIFLVFSTAWLGRSARNAPRA